MYCQVNLLWNWQGQHIDNAGSGAGFPAPLFFYNAVIFSVLPLKKKKTEESTAALV